MDHWGDPWADNANDKSPTKNAVTSPLPPSFTFAPVPLNGFADDAGWGNNDDDGFGDWTTPVADNTASTHASRAVEGADPGSAGWGTGAHEERDDISAVWPEPSSDVLQDLEKVESEPSDSSTVSQVDEAVHQDLAAESIQAPTDLESSVRSSTSPSETSRNELPIESPRTSVEEERTTKKEVLVSEPLAVVADSQPDFTRSSAELATQEKEEGGSESEFSERQSELTAETGDTDAASASSDNQSVSNSTKDPAVTPGHSSATHTAQPYARPKTFVCDEALVADLFPSGGKLSEELDEHDDPIFSTSARKAWYRLTRKQTMREFNHGDSDDNYIRVTWTNSHVRSEVHKVVSRWAREDRISGTGPGARASFYWDTPVPAEPTIPFGHLRTQSSVPAKKTALPSRQSLPPLGSNKSAAFDWSSSVFADSRKLEGPVQGSAPGPLAPKNPIVAKVQRQDGRALSVDLTPRKSELTMHKRTATVSHTYPETMIVANPISEPTIRPFAEGSDSLTSTNKLDGPSASTIITTAVSVDDDDDDWGEMVQTPTLPTPPQLDPFSQPPEPRIKLPSPPLPTSKSPVSTESEAVPVESMFAAPIVRLRSTISPTSALFRANSFVPLNAEQGPIGPGILRPANRLVRAAPDEKLTIDCLEHDAETPMPATVPLDEDEGGEPEEPLPWTSRTSISTPIESVSVGHSKAEDFPSMPTVEPTTPLQAPADSWADADFSFFESALPVTAPSASPDPSDPFSFFDAPAPASVLPPVKAFSRSPPQNTTPPTLQPLGGATSSVQRRKAEEDQIVKDILSGLPDLSYMLRQ